MIKEISSYSEFNEIIEANKSAIIFFISKSNYSNQELDKTFISTNLNIYWINIDEFIALKIKYKIKESLNLAIFQNKRLLFITNNMTLIADILKQDSI